MPTLWKFIIQVLCVKESRKRSCEPDIISCIIISIILRQHNEKMNIFQCLVSVLLYSGHAIKKVCIQCTILKQKTYRSTHVHYYT